MIILKSFQQIKSSTVFLGSEDYQTLCSLLLFPLNFECNNIKEYFACFADLPPDDIERIIYITAKDLIIKYYHKQHLWNIFTQKINTNLILIREANKIIHKDFVFFNYKHLIFYEKALPIAYGFIKYDKKHFSSDFVDYFTVIYKSILEYRPRMKTEYLEEGPFTVKEAFGLLNKLFLDANGCENSGYAGLYFIYTHFEATVTEFYAAYCLTNDSCFLEYLSIFLLV